MGEGKFLVGGLQSQSLTYSSPRLTLDGPVLRLLPCRCRSTTPCPIKLTVQRVVSHTQAVKGRSPRSLIHAAPVECRCDRVSTA